MPRPGSAIFSVLTVFCAFSVPLLSAAAPLAHRLFYDDFSGGLSPYWVPFNLPGPRVTRSRGNPPPALDNAGDGKRRNGVISKRLFPLGAGVVVRADIFLSGGAGDSVFGGSLGFPTDSEVFLRGQWPEWLVGISYDYIGETDWSRGAIPEGGTLTCALIDEDGRLEISRRPYLNRWLGGWHNFEIKIWKSGFVEFSLDGELVYYSRKRISYRNSHLPLLLGHLSGRGGRVYHDNIEVLAWPGPSGPGPGSGE
jgi:hypothetical protein